MTAIVDFFTKLKNTAFSIGIIDIVEILIMAFVIYKIFVWMKNTRTWVVLKGIVAILLLILFAEMFQLNTILFILKGASSVIIIALVVVFQPELRSALEKLGKGSILVNVFKKTKRKIELDEITLVRKEIITAVNNLAKDKIGALIVIEKEDLLNEYIATGISIDAKISAQLLVNIFEHNTPLHDGAVIIRDNRIASATSYLPLSSDGEISKQYGTRHRAAIGLSETSDSIIIVVSEETGKISIAKDGKLIENVGSNEISQELESVFAIQAKESEERGEDDEESNSK